MQRLQWRIFTRNISNYKQYGPYTMYSSIGYGTPMCGFTGSNLSFLDTPSNTFKIHLCKSESYVD